MEKVPVLGQSRQIRVLRTLGEGGFGAVYLAEIAGPDGFVQRAALKVLHKTMASHGDIAGRQRDEARLLAQLNHDHIVKVLDLGEYDGRPAVLMEYVDGIDAHGLLQQGALPPRVVMEIVAATASALDAASNATSPSTGKPLRVVHRDIKPANLLVTAQGGVKVLDFGVARAEFDREGATKSVLFGTARFMAPEMFLEGSSGPAVDIYALGVTAIELLGAGTYARPPLHPEFFEGHVEEALAPLSIEAIPGWTEELRDLIRSMLAYEKRDRPNAGQVHDRASELAERAPGAPLRRWARQVVPPLLAERATRAQAVPPPPAQQNTRFTPASPVRASPGDSPRREAVPMPLVETAPERLSASASASVASASVSHEVEPTGILSAEVDVLASAATPVLAETSQPIAARSSRRAPLAALAAGLVVVGGAAAAWFGPELMTGELAPEPEIPVATSTPAQTTEEAPPGEPPAAEPEASTSVGRTTLAEPDPPPLVSSRSRATPPPTPQPASQELAAESTPAIPAPALSCAAGPGRVGITFGSNPLGAEVWAAGSRLGTTPLSSCGLPEGSYAVTMRSEGRSTTHEVRVSSRTARSFIWDVESGHWNVGE